MDDHSERFGGIGRLYGAAAAEAFRKAHALVVGIGGVGSWAAEALARSGVGRITLVDLDEVCVTNINRQIHALEDTVGQSKAEVMAARLRSIWPGIRAEAVNEFFHGDNARRLLGLDEAFLEARPQVVVDAIDAMSNKVRLIALCREAGIPVVVCGAAGGRRDPTRIRVSDLAEVTHDRLLAEVRKRMRKEHGCARDGRKLRIPCVHSAETPMFPDGAGGVCEAPPPTDGTPRKLGCASGYGSATAVTGSFGFVAAARALEILGSPAAPKAPEGRPEAGPE